MSAGGPVAAIDVGTNTCLLLVAQEGPESSLRVLRDRMRRPQLGKGLAAGGCLDREAVERTLEVLAEFQQVVAEFGIPQDRCRAAGTAVLRRAADGADFVALVRRRLSLDLQVLSGAEEARLAYESAAAETNEPGNCLVLDVGGGSCEAAWEAGEQRVSIPVGALGLTEKYLGPRSGSGWPELLGAVRAAFEACPDSAGQGRSCLLLGGAAANLVALVRGGSRFDVEGLHGLRATAEQAWRWAHHLQGLGLAERRALPIEQDRAEILPAGLACLAALLERCGATEGRFSTQGLRFGLAGRLLRVPEAERRKSL